jgi:hypothetical protein
VTGYVELDDLVGHLPPPSRWHGNGGIAQSGFPPIEGRTATSKSTGNRCNIALVL